MSSTKLPFQLEPLTEGDSVGRGEGTPRTDSLLIVVGHGTGTPNGDMTLHKFVAELVRRGIFADVKAALLRGEPALADVVHAAKAGSIRLLPFLMGRGVTFGQRLAETMAKISWPEKPLLYPPLGLNPALAELLARRAEAAARALSWPRAESHLLLIAHGSLRDPASSEATRLHQTRIAGQERFASVEVAFLEQTPYLDTVLSSHGGPILGVGLFAGEGQHGAQDMARAFAKAACPAHYCGAIGGDKGLPDLALNHLLQIPPAISSC